MVLGIGTTPYVGKNSQISHFFMSATLLYLVGVCSSASKCRLISRVRTLGMELPQIPHGLVLLFHCEDKSFIVNICDFLFINIRHNKEQ